MRVILKPLNRFPALQDLLTFVYLEALCCIFPATIMLSLALSKHLELPIPRYDFMLLVCLAMQAVMVLSKLETVDELKVVCMFHIFGLSLELFKVHHGSWSYPEFAHTKIWDVPIYSGFMYASVASYICQAWRRFNLKFSEYPSWTANLFAILLYLNFFSNHYIEDQRWGLALALIVLMWNTRVHFQINHRPHQMPLTLSFLLIGLFIWLAENISTFYGAWKYPNQQDVWHAVHFSKISSWALLVILSFVLIAKLKGIKSSLQKTRY
ncbi:DUF817 domain-containing protein [Deinococcus roseus]|uniref:DUF817 domain-containing protein n=1 Tax=Deinococcus roseus TaxID=392414 RepID=A0ABQ2D1A5_9DEIO|nr:DUF817 domain-containing protein [Deinococcus roseus]GGJ41115.1 hypothetical protein GCM10008938_28930 [Deinococcus roseus]